jgi:hypothetical protein
MHLLSELVCFVLVCQVEISQTMVSTSADALVGQPLMSRGALWGFVMFRPMVQEC